MPGVVADAPEQSSIVEQESDPNNAASETPVSTANTDDQAERSDPSANDVEPDTTVSDSETATPEETN